MSEPKERPILFSGPMVRAIIDGRKTQTRRIIKPQPPDWIDELHGGQLSKRAPYELENHDNQIVGWGFQDERGTYWRVPYGKPGDRLWVRETHCKYGGGFIYRADYGDLTPISDGIGGPWKPSIHMPRIASRITLEIIAVCVERLNDISRGDAMAEGRPHSNLAYGQNPCDWFHELWESINGPESWAANPWVWVIEFKKVEVAR
jgi:hypothetical protein